MATIQGSNTTNRFGASAFTKKSLSNAEYLSLGTGLLQQVTSGITTYLNNQQNQNYFNSNANNYSYQQMTATLNAQAVSNQLSILPYAQKILDTQSSYLKSQENNFNSADEILQGKRNLNSNQLDLVEKQGQLALEGYLLQEQIDNANLDYAQNDIYNTYRMGEYSAMLQGLQDAQIIHNERAKTASSGVRMNEGSKREVYNSNQLGAELNQYAIQQSTNSQAEAKKTQAQSLLYQKRANQIEKYSALNENLNQKLQVIAQGLEIEQEQLTVNQQRGQVLQQQINLLSEQMSLNSQQYNLTLQQANYVAQSIIADGNRSASETLANAQNDITPTLMNIGSSILSYGLQNNLFNYLNTSNTFNVTSSVSSNGKIAKVI